MESALIEECVLCDPRTWRAAGTVGEVQSDKLRRFHIGVTRDSTRRVAARIDSIRVASGQAPGACWTRERLGDSIVFYPSARPLRGLIIDFASPVRECDEPVALSQLDLVSVIAEFDDALSSMPWLNTRPMRFRNAL